MPRGRSAQAQKELPEQVETYANQVKEHTTPAEADVLGQQDGPQTGDLINQAATKILAAGGKDGWQPYLPNLDPSQLDEVRATILEQETEVGAMKERAAANHAARMEVIAKMERSLDMHRRHEALLTDILEQRALHAEVP